MNDQAPAPAPEQPQAARQPQGISMEAVLDSLSACVSALSGESDDRQERRDREKILVGTSVLRQICNRQLLLVTPQQIQQPNRQQRRAAAANSRQAKPSKPTASSAPRKKGSARKQ